MLLMVLVLGLIEILWTFFLDENKWDFWIRQSQTRIFLRNGSIDPYFHYKNIQTWRKWDTLLQTSVSVNFLLSRGLDL